MRISIAGDHAGFEQAHALAAYLSDEGYDIIDRGPSDDSPVDYPDFAVLVADDVATGAADRGILVCGTGIGMAIAANKVPGIRAANVTSRDFAVLAREHNDANVLALSGRYVSLEENKRIADAFLTTDFSEGHHTRRIEKITAIECGRIGGSTAAFDEQDER